MSKMVRRALPVFVFLFILSQRGTAAVMEQQQELQEPTQTESEKSKLKVSAGKYQLGQLKSPGLEFDSTCPCLHETTTKPRTNPFTKSKRPGKGGAKGAQGEF